MDVLRETETASLLRLTHRCPPGDHWETYGPAAVGVGWEESLRALALFLAGDSRSAPAEMEKFAGTPDGQDLTRRVASAWGREDEESGTPASRAGERVQRTVESYLQM